MNPHTLKARHSAYFVATNEGMRMKVSMMTWIWAAGLLLAVLSCKKGKDAPEELLQKNDKVLMVNEIPAGDLAADHALLPAPGNMGSIMGTETSAGQPLRGLIIGAAAKKGVRIEIWPLGAVQWRTGQELQTCIIAISPEQAAAGLEDFMALRLAHDDVRTTLEHWFRRHYIPSNAEWLGWQNEVYARAEIQRAYLR